MIVLESASEPRKYDNTRRSGEYIVTCGAREFLLLALEYAWILEEDTSRMMTEVSGALEKGGEDGKWERPVKVSRLRGPDFDQQLVLSSFNGIFHPDNCSG